MPYVSVGISDGVGNRLFQVAAMLGYAEKYGYTPIFVRQWIGPTNHGGPHSITDLFPSVRIADIKDIGGDWTFLTQDGTDVFKYVELPRVEGHVKLVGYFQTEKYFPRVFPFPRILDTIAIPALSYDSCAFLHIRRGDYLLPVCAHHNVDLTTYRRCALAAYDASVKIIVCSDDMEWCRRMLPALYGDLVADDRWVFLDAETTNIATLAVMARCGAGGICSNSTFSWWGSCLGSRRGHIFMPGTWGHAPLPAPQDLYPRWATLLPT